MPINQTEQGDDANELSAEDPADVSLAYVGDVGDVADQKNNLDELSALTIHCEKAAEQLRELIDLTALDEIESAAKKSGEAGPSGFLENTRQDCISAVLPLDNFQKIKRISRAAVEGFLLDREDLIGILEDEKTKTNAHADLQSVLTQLEKLLPQSQEEIVTKFCAAYLADNNIAPIEGEPLAVPPHIELLAEILEIREPLKCYEEAARISREAVIYAVSAAQASGDPEDHVG